MIRRLAQTTRCVRPDAMPRGVRDGRMRAPGLQRRVVASVAMLGSLALSTQANAADGDRTLPPPGDARWQPLALPRVDRKTRYTTVQIEGVDVVRADADCSASALLHRTPDLDLAAMPWLRWRWRVDVEDSGGADPRTKPGDDFAARVYVLFRFDAANASIAERMRHALGQSLFATDLPGDAINYVFTSRAAAGDTWNNPFTKESKMVSMGSPTTGHFIDLAANVLDDYRELFGRPPPPVVGVALMSDADQRCGRSTAWFGDFRFTRDPPETGRPARHPEP